MDREENKLPMAQSCPFPWHATHVTSVDDVGGQLSALANAVDSDAVRELADGWRELADMPQATFKGWQSLPGFEASIGDPGDAARAEYMIWREPWMAISTQTFIGSMLTKVGLGDALITREQPYPELADADLPREDTCYLFSTEPFPFGRYVEELETLGFNGALVDGEFYSWFGSRSYRLLKEYLERVTSR